MTPENEERFVAETLRLNERYLTEVVERFKFCPWALQTRRDGRLARHVLLQPNAELEPAVALMEAWSERPDVDVGLMIFPLIGLSPQPFERFANRLERSYSARSGLTSPKMALAAFHPDVEPNLSSPERLVPFVRRSPDPTIQLVRISALEAVRSDEAAGTQYMDVSKLTLDLASLRQFSAPQPSLRQRISKANLDTVQAQLVELKLTHRAIQQDHHLVHQRFFGSPGQETS